MPPYYPHTIWLRWAAATNYDQPCVAHDQPTRGVQELRLAPVDCRNELAELVLNSAYRTQGASYTLTRAASYTLTRAASYTRLRELPI